MSADGFTILGGVALGTGIDEAYLARAQTEYELDAIAWDNGTVDFGPQLLGGNRLYQPVENTKADLRKLMEVRQAADVPLLISSAVGAGAEHHVDVLAEIVTELVEAEFDETTIAKIYTDVDRSQLKRKIELGEVSRLDFDRDLTEEAVEDSENIVSMVGPEPFVAALNDGADVVVGGRALDVSPFAALPIREGVDRGLAIHLGKLMECGGLVTDTPVSSDPVVGIVSGDHFDLVPANPRSRCTVDTVSKHHLYEKSDPYVVHVPDGLVNLRGTDFEQIDDRRVRVSGATFEAKETPAVLLEGAGKTGFQTIAIGGIRSPDVIAAVDEIIADVRSHVAETTDASNEEYELVFKKYGIDAVPLYPVRDPTDRDPHEVGILIRAVGDTREIANNVCESARFWFFARREYDPSGAMANPVSQSTIEAGDGYRFTIHHLMEIDDLTETCRTETEVIP